MRPLYLLLVFVAAWVSFAVAQPGTLDPGFMQSGKLIYPGMRQGNAILLTHQRKAIMAGDAALQKDIPDLSNTDFALACFMPKGDMATEFGDAGRVCTDFNRQDDVVKALALQHDGKIVAAGYSRLGGLTLFAVARYFSDGRPDTEFGTGGKVLVPFYPNGVSSFSNTFVEQEDSRLCGVAIQPKDGKIILAGTVRRSPHEDFDIGVARLNPDGSRDPSFGENGIAITDLRLHLDDYAHAMLLLPSGEFMVAGKTLENDQSDMVVMRFLHNGTLDPDFGEGGYIRIDYEGSYDAANAMVLQPDGKVVVAGVTGQRWASDFAMVRVNPTGSLDESFGRHGRVRTDLGANDLCYAVARQEDGRLLAAGGTMKGANSDFAVVRYQADGILDEAYGQAVPMGHDVGAITDFGGDDIAYAAAVDWEGKLLVTGRTVLPGGGSYLAAARYMPGRVLQTTALASIEGLRVYPNPMSESATVEYALTQPEQISIALYDAGGKLVRVYVRQQYQPAGPYSFSLQMDPNTACGVYTLRIFNDKAAQTVPVVIGE